MLRQSGESAVSTPTAEPKQQLNAEKPFGTDYNMTARRHRRTPQCKLSAIFHTKAVVHPLLLLRPIPPYPILSHLTLSYPTLSYHRRVLFGVRLPQLEHLALDHVRDMTPEPVGGQLVGVGLPLDAAQVLPGVVGLGVGQPVSHDGWRRREGVVCSSSESVKVA